MVVSHTLPSAAVIALSITEFLSGMVKSLGTGTKIGITVLTVFTSIQALCGLLIGESILMDIGTLEFVLSQVIFILVIIVECMYLLSDIKFAIDAHQDDDDNTRWMDIIMITLKSIPATFLCMSPSLVFTLIGFSRVEWSIPSVVVTDIVRSKHIPLSCWILISGLIFLLLPLLIFFLFYLFSLIMRQSIRELNDVIYVLPPLVSCVIGTSLVSGAVWKAEEELADGYMFITLTVITPAASATFRLFKTLFWTRLKTRRSESNNNGPGTEPSMPPAASTTIDISKS